MTPPRKRKPKPAKPSGPPASQDEHAASWMVRWMAIITIACLAGAAVLIVGVYPSGKGFGLGRPVEIDYEGESAEELASKLQSLGLIDNPRVFVWYLRLTGGTRAIVRGHHLLTDDASARELLHRLERHGAERAKVVVPEGWTRFDIAKRLDSLHVCTTRSFLDATTSEPLLHELHIPGKSAEGYLFPATYDLELDSDPPDIVRQMARLFDKKWSLLEGQHDKGMKELSDTLGWGKAEIITLASMIEKEAAVDEERGVIASVFLNRLRDASFKPARKLQSDPTSGYGCLALFPPPPSCMTYTGKITHDINVDPANTYSTYVNAGLPPSPICNPGAKSIEAVLNPALTHYYFFVAKGGGRHTFSETLADHNAAIQQ